MKSRKRSKHGSFKAEFAAAVTFGLPLLLLLVYVGLEICQFYTIKSAMEVGARNAARALVVNYNKTGIKITTVYFITIPKYINSSTQFVVTWDTATPPTFVSVTCSFPNGGGGTLVTFPAGPLRYLKSATFDFRTVRVQGTFTCPVQ